jgi:hypothetical protein
MEKRFAEVGLVRGLEGICWDWLFAGLWRRYEGGLLWEIFLENLVWEY